MPRNDKPSVKPSRHSSSKHATSDSIEYPTAWSEWERDDKHQRFISYCLVAPGQYEYGYKDYNIATQSQASSSYQSIPETHYNYGTSSQSYASPEPTQASSRYSSASQSQTTSGLHPISESPPYTSTIQYTHKSSLDNVTNNMQNMSLGDEKDKDPPKTGTVIKTRNRHNDTELGPFGGPHYKVYQQNEFKAGKILILNWVEPSGSTKGKGSNRSEHTVITKEPGIGKDGTEQYQKVRRFLIVKAFKGHCLCLPINTYSFQGVNKNGVHADNHAVIYSEHPPTYIPGEKEKGLVRPAILMVPSNPANKLHFASRLNYAKVYTIEYNVKVRFIGQIHPQSGHEVAAAYNSIHQAMQPLPGAIKPFQSSGESSRPQQPLYSGNSSYSGTNIYPGTGPVTTGSYGGGYSGNTPYAGSAATQGQTSAYGQNTPYPSYPKNISYVPNTYSRTTSYDQSTGATSSQSSGGTPRTFPYSPPIQQPNTAAYTTRYLQIPSSTHQSPSQEQILPSRSYPGGRNDQLDDYSSTNYQKRDYETPDNDLYDE